MHSRVQDFVRLIFDQNMMKKTLESMNVDVTKMPLGKIKKSQIKDGYNVRFTYPRNTPYQKIFFSGFDWNPKFDWK